MGRESCSRGPSVHSGRAAEEAEAQGYLFKCWAKDGSFSHVTSLSLSLGPPFLKLTGKLLQLGSYLCHQWAVG